MPADIIIGNKGDMRDHLTRAEMIGYLEQALNPRALVDVDSHLEECGQCRLGVSQLDPLESAIDEVVRDHHGIEASEAEHLTSDQLTNFVISERDLFNRKLVSKHLKICSSCAEELEDLLSLKKEMEVEVPAAGASRSTSFLNRLPAGFTRPARLLPTNSWALAITLALCVGLLLYALTYFSDFKRRGEVAVNNTSAPARPAIPLPTPSPVAPKSMAPAGAGARTNTPEIRQGETTAEDTDSRPKVSPPSKNQPHRTPAHETTRHANSQTLIARDGGGRQVRVDNRGRITGLPALPPDQRKEVARALINQEIADIRMPPEHAVKSFEVRSAAKEGEDRDPPSEKPSVTLLSPVGTFVGDIYVTLRWKPVDGADKLTLSVVDERFEPVIATTEIVPGATLFKIPVALTPGTTYTWQVKASVDGKEVKSSSATGTAARFTVLSRENLDRMRRLKNRYAESSLVLGVLYAREGLFDDAERELRELLRANPRSAAARKLLRSLRSKRDPLTP